jgi:sugar O-acyltransferase (sialic acid O-acetyltransferase NeuD family)
MRLASCSALQSNNAERQLPDAEMANEYSAQAQLSQGSGCRVLRAHRRRTMMKTRDEGKASMNQQLQILSPREAEVIVLGIGGHAKVVIATLQAAGYRVVEAYDDDPALWGRQILGVPVTGPLSSIGATHHRAVIGFGDNGLRQKVASSLPLKWLTVVHPSATVHPSARLGVGTVVFAGAVVQPDVRIGQHVILNTTASVDHDCVLGDFVHISPGAHLSGSVHVGDGAFLGIASAAIPHVSIGAWTTVGAGGVVVRDLPDHVTAVGVPAHRDLRKILPAGNGKSRASASPGSANTAHGSTSPAPHTHSGVPLRGEFIAPDDARWMDFLQRVRHDFYHLPEYVRLEAEQSVGTATAFYAEQGEARFLIPLVLCRSPFSRGASPAWQDATSPYGYACPLLLTDGDGPSGEEQLERFWEAFRTAGKAQNIVTVFLRLHPLLPLPTKPLEKNGQLVRHGQTIYLDLNTDADKILAGYCRNHRRDLRRIAAAGFQVALDHWDHYPQFIEIYRSTMKRRDAEDMYFFEGNYFERLREALGENLHLATVVSPLGEIAGGEIFVSTCGIVQNHLSGTADGFHRFAPAKLLTNHVRRWAQSQGEKLFHLGGGLGGREDSLFQFKAGFSSHRADFYTYRIVLDPSKYQQLVERWRLSGGQVSEAGDFFPLYRRPIS